MARKSSVFLVILVIMAMLFTSSASAGVNDCCGGSNSTNSDVQPQASIYNYIGFDKSTLRPGERTKYTAQSDFVAWVIGGTSCMNISINARIFDKPTVTSNNTGKNVSYSYVANDSYIGGDPSWHWGSGVTTFIVLKQWTVEGYATVRSTTPPNSAGENWVGQKNSPWCSGGSPAYATVYVI